MAYPTSAPAAVDSESKPTVQGNINDILPPELLVLAFSFPISDAVDAISLKSPERPDGAEMQRRFSQHPLWNASLVCRAWYEIIKETPRFWAFVAIGVTPLSGPRTDAGYHSKTATPPVPRQNGKSNGIEILLARSGHLPLTIVMFPESIQDFDTVSEAIQKHFDRLEVLSLIGVDKGPEYLHLLLIPSRPTVHQVLGLLARPMPSLKLLSFSIYLKPLTRHINGCIMGIRKDVDAPELETLSCHTHLIIPESPTRLSSLSLTGVDILQLRQRSAELPHLVDLRIENCDVGTILSSFVIPSLRHLVVGNWGWYIRSNPAQPPQLPRYDSLQEMQWWDTFEDPAFVQLCRLCPNLKRYWNYIEGDSIQKAIKKIDQLPFKEEIRRPMIFTVLDEDVLGGANAYRHWPVLEEVSLNDASCDHVATLIKAVPSIKRVRILRDRGQFCKGERDKLAVLWGKVEIAIRDEPWESGSGGNETPRRVGETL